MRWPSCRRPAANGTSRKTLKKLRPDNLFRKVWRWLRDRRRYAGNPEAKFFFPAGVPRLDHPELVREVPHINRPEVVKMARDLKPDLICVFGTSLIEATFSGKAASASSTCTAGCHPNIAVPIALSGRFITANRKRPVAPSITSMLVSTLAA